MEIVKTSETLEQQILEDARRKASRVLEAAEKDARALAGQWEAKTRDEVARIGADAEARERALRQELEASLPLDFMRTRLAATDEALRAALAELFAGMAPQELGRVLGALLARAARAFTGTRVTVLVSGMPAEAARRVVGEFLPGAAVDEVRGAGSGQETGGGDARGLVVETRDGKVRCRATVGELTSLLLEERREELVRALLGGGEGR